MHIIVEILPTVILGLFVFIRVLLAGNGVDLVRPSFLTLEVLILFVWKILHLFYGFVRSVDRPWPPFAIIPNHSKK